MEDEDEEGPPAVECRKPENSLEPSCDEPCGNSEHGKYFFFFLFSLYTLHFSKIKMDEIRSVFVG